ncbi:MAG: hypothetical protein DME75_08270 [Verrucomicrobia bacterium]|nr:MAG: hypothetical protein DME75_08270 [Verrucomicrobiota bacterium]
MQFLDYAVAPLPAEASFCKIPAAAENKRNCDENRQTHYVYSDAMRQSRRLSILRWRPNLRRLEDGGHGVVETLQG